jgi:hypothetical protein
VALHLSFFHIEVELKGICFVDAGILLLNVTKISWLQTPLLPIHISSVAFIIINYEISLTGPQHLSYILWLLIPQTLKETGEYIRP